jgi:hypothetical protein
MMKKLLTFAAAAALSATAGSALAQQTTQQNPLASILGAIFGQQTGVTNTLEGQWALGRTPLTGQRVQFDTRVDTEVRNRTISADTGARLKADYAELVRLEGQYAADGRFTTAERTALSDRYGELTQVLAQGGYVGGTTALTAEVATGRAEFDRRVDAAVTARRLTRTAATRLKADYAALVQVESGYLRDGVITAAERDDLDARLDALDARVGDVALTAAVQTPRARLDAIAAALPTAGLGRPAQAQLLVEIGDLTRLDAAYARSNPSAEERAYLERRIVELETRARIR